MDLVWLVVSWGDHHQLIFQPARGHSSDIRLTWAQRFLVGERLIKQLEHSEHEQCTQIPIRFDWINSVRSSTALHPSEDGFLWVEPICEQRHQTGCEESPSRWDWQPGTSRLDYSIYLCLSMGERVGKESSPLKRSLRHSCPERICQLWGCREWPGLVKKEKDVLRTLRHRLGSLRPLALVQVKSCWNEWNLTKLMVLDLKNQRIIIVKRTLELSNIYNSIFLVDDKNYKYENNSREIC